MDDIPLAWQYLLLAVLLVISGFFSIAETSMMALNRYRLKALARMGNRGAKVASELLAKTDKLLGVILLGNNLVNAGAATLVGVIAIRLFGDEKIVLAGGTLVITFLILIFSEITPKVIGDMLHIEMREGAAFIPQLVQSFPGQIESVTLSKPTLDDVFIRKTGHSIWQEDAMTNRGAA